MLYTIISQLAKIAIYNRRRVIELRRIEPKDGGRGAGQVDLFWRGQHVGGYSWYPFTW